MFWGNEEKKFRDELKRELQISNMGFTNHIQERELQQASFESTPVKHVGISRPLAQENNPYKFWGVPPLCKQ